MMFTREGMRVRRKRRTFPASSNFVTRQFSQSCEVWRLNAASSTSSKILPGGVLHFTSPSFDTLHEILIVKMVVLSLESAFIVLIRPEPTQAFLSQHGGSRRVISTWPEVAGVCDRCEQ